MLPLGERPHAVRDFRRHLKNGRRAPNQLTASPRDKAIALLPYYAGLRISEVVGLDLADVRLSVAAGGA
jgi:site-specific recombinase XerC